MPVSPGRLLEFEGTTLADAAVIGAREAAGIEEHRGEPRRRERRQRRLHMRTIRQSVGADLAAAPGLRAQPCDRIEAVRAFAYVFGEEAFRIVPAATVLHS